MQGTGEGMPGGCGLKQVILGFTSLPFNCVTGSVFTVFAQLSAPVTKPITRTQIGICS